MSGLKDAKDYWGLREKMLPFFIYILIAYKVFLNKLFPKPTPVVPVVAPE